MEWVIIALVPVLIVTWRYLWSHRKVTTKQVMPDVREALADRLQHLANEAREESRFAEVQQLELQATWLRAKPDIGGDAPPEELSGEQERHVRFAGAIWEQYGSFLADEGLGFDGCRYKPESLLPLPKYYIAKALTFLVDVGEGREPCSFINTRSISEDALVVMKEASEQLTGFLSVTADDLPTDPAANSEFGEQYTMRMSE